MRQELFNSLQNSFQIEDIGFEFESSANWELSILTLFVFLPCYNNWNPFKLE